MQFSSARVTRIEPFNVEIVLKAAVALRDKRIRFHIVGDGTDVERLKKLKEKHKLNNVIFHGRQPLEKMPKYYSMADAMLVTLEADPVLSLTLPGKVQTYRAAGKPIIGSINGETAKIISDAHCGYCGPANSLGLFIENIGNFHNNLNKYRLSQNSRNYYTKHFSKSLLLNTLEDVLNYSK